MRQNHLLVFVLPSLLVMLLLIGAPTVSVVVQSFFDVPQRTLVTHEICGPFGCASESGVATDALAADAVAWRFAGLHHYADRSHLAVAELAAAWQAANGPGDFITTVFNLPFYRALLFTLAYTLTVTPVAMVLGLWLAYRIKNLAPLWKAPAIFITLLPMVITPLMGALTLFWMLDSHGILGALLRALSGDASLSVRSSPQLTWLTLLLHGVWQSAPLAFVVYYAGLHTVPRSLLDAARVDGASRGQTLRYVVLPHLLPMTAFLLLIQLMDNFRVLDPVVGFGAEAFVRSLSFNVYADLRGDAVRFNSAATTSSLMILLLLLLMTPVLVRLARQRTSAGLRSDMQSES